MKRSPQHVPSIAVAISVIGLLAYGFWPTPIEVDLVHAHRGQFQLTVRDDGETRIKEKYIVSAPVDGRLLRIEIHPGDIVCVGQTVVARVEPTDPSLLDARTQAQLEARVGAAEANHQRSQAELSQQTNAFEAAQHEFTRVNELKNTNAISQATVDQVEHQYHIAKAGVNSAVFSAKIAEFELAQARAALVRTPGSDNSSSSLTIHSPIDGRVLRVFREDEGVVSPGSPIVELGNSSEMEMLIDLLSTDAVRVRPGAKVFVEHWGGTGILEGTVRVIEPAAFLKISALGIEEKRVKIVADFTTPLQQRESLGDGYRFEARIVVAEYQDAATVPSGVLLRDGEKWYVFKVVDGRAKQQSVKIGESNGMDTRILNGVVPEDELILYPTDKIRDGVRVFSSTARNHP